MTMVSREPREITGHMVSRDKTAGTIQQMVDAAPTAKQYCTDGYYGYLDVVFPGKHIFNHHSKKETFTVEGWKIFRQFLPSLFRRKTVSADLKCYTAPGVIPLLFLSPSLISFKSSFGHSQKVFPVERTGRICYDQTTFGSSVLYTGGKP